MNYTIKNDLYTATVKSLGGELISLRTNEGRELLWQNGVNENFWSDHAPVLFPVCGRLKNKQYTYKGKTYSMDMHGFANQAEFELAEAGENYVTLLLSDTEETRKIYPFSFRLELRYELSGEEILFSAKVTNNSSETMPYMFGWHPGFNLPTSDGLDINDYKLDFGSVTELNWHRIVNGAFVSDRVVNYPLVDNAYKLCEKEIYENDTMIFTGHNNEVKLYADGKSFGLSMKWTENLPTLCIWKEDNSAAKFLCIEPWSSAPRDGVTDENFDVRPMPRLEAGKTDSYAYSLKFSF